MSRHPLSEISLRQLEYVVAVADTLGFRKAAERCHVSQPALSTQIRDLEDRLGVILFERDARRVLVTPAGEQIILRARKVLSEAQGLVEAVERLQDPLSGTLRFGVIPTIGPYVLPELTAAVTRRFARLKIYWWEDKTSVLLKALDEGALDAVLLALEADLGQVVVAEVAQDPFVLALSPGHALLERAHVTEADLEGQPLLLLEEGHCLRDQALQACSSARVKESGFRATSLGTLAQMVSAGAGLTLLPRLAVAVENRRGTLRLRPFRSPGPRRTIALVWRPQSPIAVGLKKIAEAFAAEWPVNLAEGS